MRGGISKKANHQEADENMPERTFDFLRGMLNYHGADELPVGSSKFWKDISVPDSSDFLFLLLIIDQEKDCISLKMYVGKHNIDDYAPPWQGAIFQKERRLPLEMCDKVKEELTPLDWTLSKISGRRYLNEKERRRWTEQ